MGVQRKRLKHLLIIATLLIFQWSDLTLRVESKCNKGCPMALASYYVSLKANLTFIAAILNASVNDALSYNPSVPDLIRLQSFIRVNIPFPCDCVNRTFLGHVFQYRMSRGDNFDIIAKNYYSNLTTVSWMRKFNSYDPENVPENAIVNVPVNCSCGEKSVSDKYGLFLTYPLLPEDNLTFVAKVNNSTESLLRKYNPGVDFDAGNGLVFIPAKDKTGHYPPLYPSSGISSGVIAGISVAIVVGLTIFAGVFFVLRRKMRKDFLLHNKSGKSSKQFGRTSERGGGGVTVDKSVEFKYEELAQATNDFSIANQIGAGGFGYVYFAELRGKKAAIKKMDKQASKEFLAEMNVLTRVHHMNLVCLIGYCVEHSLFLVYEYVENGNLSQHLRGREALPWATRVQIAIDAARGLEYIHEHTVPIYIHRDIKSANILIDNNFHAKVADFGLTKLTEFGTASGPSNLVGTFGYMPPEYAQYGKISAKVDVYAFGVVLYELISAKEAVVRGTTGPDTGLVALFESVLSRPDKSEIQTLVDPRLEDNYPLASLLKMADLAKSCTQEKPQLRPSMRSVVVALMSLSSSTPEWNTGSYYAKE